MQAQRLPAERGVHHAARDEADAHREALPAAPVALRIEHALHDAPGGVAEQADGRGEQQHAAERLAEHRQERAARAR